MELLDYIIKGVVYYSVFFAITFTVGMVICVIYWRWLSRRRGGDE